MKKRNSNIELLRIVCMLFIVVHHFVTHGVFDGVLNDTYVLDKDSMLGLILHSFSYVAVNCFVMISGYFSIRFTWRNLGKLYFVCFFYGLVGCLLGLILGVDVSVKEIFYDTLLVFSHSPWWFIKCYVILVFLSPILNKAIVFFSKKEYQQVLVLLTILNLYFGYFWKQDMYNVNGYSAAQFVYVYMIGGYLKHHVDMDWFYMHRLPSLGVYILGSVLFAGISILQHYYTIPHWGASMYNNPLLMVSSIAFFSFFLGQQFQNKYVNVVAASVLPVYLIQDHPSISSMLYELAANIASPPHCKPFVLICGCFVFGVFYYSC